MKPGTIAIREPLPVTRWKPILRDAELFGDLPETLLDYILQHAQERALRDKDLLYLKHSPNEFVAIVLQGFIHTLHTSADGRELISGRFGPGALVGETAFIDDDVRSASAIAYGETRTLVLAKRHFPFLLAEPVFLLHITRLLTHRLKQSTHLIESMCLNNLEARLALYFLSIIDQQLPANTPNVTRDILVPMPPTQGILAAMINVSRPKLNAQLRSWQKAGLITLKNDHLQLNDLPQLRLKARTTM